MVAKRTSKPQTTDTPPVALTWKQVAAWRARRQHLERRTPRAEMLDVARDICGLHAQIASTAGLALWARVEGMEPGEVERALWEERSLVKTWAMRGTLHLLPAAEFRLWVAALGTRRAYQKPGWLRGWDITREELEQLLAAINQALDGRQLTREALAAEVAEQTGSASLGERIRGSWGSFLKPAAIRGELCFAPSVGQNVRFARPDQWLGPFEPMDEDEAMREMARRFFAIAGPATRDDFSRWWWGGGEKAPATKAIASLGDELTQVDVEGERCWMPTAHLAEAMAAESRGVVRLLPAFDQYVVAASGHTAKLMPGDFRARVFRPQGWLSPVLLVDGRMEGVWKHERKGRCLVVQIEPFVTQPRRVHAAAEAEAERLAAYLGGALEVIWETQP